MLSSFTHSLSLSLSLSQQVNGKSYKRFMENQSKILKTWLFPLDGAYIRVVLEKDTLDVWVNGAKLDTAVSEAVG